jgi:hypothetical protein
MRDHWHFKIDWIGFPVKQWRKFKGVYMIGENIYIGASKHIRSRILAHLNLCATNRHNDINLIDYYSECFLFDKPIKITLLDTNPLNEYEIKLERNLVKPNETFYHQKIKGHGK